MFTFNWLKQATWSSLTLRGGELPPYRVPVKLSVTAQWWAAPVPTATRDLALRVLLLPWHRKPLKRRNSTPSSLNHSPPARCLAHSSFSVNVCCPELISTLHASRTSHDLLVKFSPLISEKRNSFYEFINYLSYKTLLSSSSIL